METQFAELESSLSTRVREIEDACRSALERVERRLELIEDELSIVRLRLREQTVRERIATATDRLDAVVCVF